MFFFFYPFSVSEVERFLEAYFSQHESVTHFRNNFTTLVTSGGQVPKTTLPLASNPTPAGWNHPCGQEYPQPSHVPPPQQRDNQNKNNTTQTWTPVTLKDIQWKPIKLD